MERFKGFTRYLKIFIYKFSYIKGYPFIKENQSDFDRQLVNILWVRKSLPGNRFRNYIINIKLHLAQPFFNEQSLFCLEGHLHNWTMLRLKAKERETLFGFMLYVFNLIRWKPVSYNEDNNTSLCSVEIITIKSIIISMLIWHH